MPYVIVEMFEGRTVEQKRAAAKAITDAIVTHLNTSAEATHVIFHWTYWTYQTHQTHLSKDLGIYLSEDPSNDKGLSNNKDSSNNEDLVDNKG